MTDTYIIKSTEEEFDDDGNLTRRTITEYAWEPTPYKVPAFSPSNPVSPVSPTYPYPIKVGDVWPYSSGTYVVTDPNKYQSYNGTFDYGSLHSHRTGGTDRNGTGEVVD